MKIAGINIELSGKKKKILKKITELTAAEKSEIEHQASLGIPPRDIADSLNLDVETIYNYRKVLNEQAKNMPVNTTKEILANKMQEREVLKADYELAKLKSDLEMQQQKMEMDKLQFARDMREWKEDILGEGSGDNDLNMKDIIALISGALQANNKKSQSTTNTATNQMATTDQVSIPLPDPVAQTQTTPTAIEEKDPDPDLHNMSDEEIKKIIDQFDKKQIKLAKALPDKILADKIADAFPSVSDQSISRAIELLRSEY